MDNDLIVLVVKVPLSFIVLFISSINILGWQKSLFKIQLKMFHEFGFNRKIMLFIGLLFAIGVTLMWFPVYNMHLGVMILLLVSFVGIVLHYRFKPKKEATAALYIFVLSLLMLFLEA